MSSNRRLNTSDYIDSPGASASDITGTTKLDTDSGREKRGLDVCVINADTALPWSKSVVVVPANSTQVVDVNLLSSFSRINYILNFKLTTILSGVAVAENLNQDSFNNINDALSYKGQNFQATATDSIASARLRMSNSSNTGSVVLEIRDTSGADPGSTVLATSDAVNISTIGTSMQDVDFTFSTPYGVTSGGSYSWVLNVTGFNDDGGSFRIGVDTGLNYAFSSAKFSSDGGSSWGTTGAFDYYFGLYGASGESIQTKGLELAVQNNNGELTDSVSVRLGGALDVLANVTDDSVDMNLEIVNNEDDDVTLTYLKSIL